MELNWNLFPLSQTKRSTNFTQERAFLQYQKHIHDKLIFLLPFIYNEGDFDLYVSVDQMTGLLYSSSTILCFQRWKTRQYFLKMSTPFKSFKLHYKKNWILPITLAQIMEVHHMFGSYPWFWFLRVWNQNWNKTYQFQRIGIGA